MTRAVAKKSPDSALRIIALTAGEPSGEWSFEKDVVTVGRGAGADVRFADNKKISRLHCVFEVRKDGVWVKDANSVNGTWLNNRRITEARVMAEDLVVVAGIRFRVLPATREEEDTPAEISVAAPGTFFTAQSPKPETSNVVPLRPVDPFKTQPEIRVPGIEVSLPEPEPEAAPAAPVLEEPAVAPQAPAFYVGGKRRPASGPRPAAAPSQGLTGGQKIALVLAIGGALVFGGAIMIGGIIAAVMMEL